MAKLQLSVAMGDYDVTRGLIQGEVVPQGIDLVPLTYRSPHRHWRMLVHEEFDVCEMSLGAFVTLVGRGDDRFVGLPVFPQRRFRHGYVFVSGAADVDVAADLRGRRIGIRNWEVTAGVYLRGILADHHGLPLDSVEWVAQDASDIDARPPAGVTLTRVESGQRVTDLCARGELAGLIYPDIPDEVHEGSGRIRRLFEDPRAEEERYFQQTGIFPIMHVVVARREVVAQHPWVCRELMEAFRESKELAMDRMRDPRTVSLAWFRWLVEREREVLGTDAWDDGVEPNRNVLETFLRYAHEQGLTPWQIEVDELFPDGVLGDPPARIAAG